MGEAIEELCEELFGGDFLSRFDLVAGTYDEFRFIHQYIVVVPTPFAVKSKQLIL